MARQARTLSSTGYYHVIVRGIGKQLLFEDSSDYGYYLLLLERFSKDSSITICAYCLMENHVHLLLLDRDNALSVFMKKMGVGYSAFFNRKYERTGHLFQDRYQSEPINNESYLLNVFRYILRNPQAAGICPFDQYAWSSYKLYGRSGQIVDTSLFSSMLGSAEEYDEFLMAATDEEYMEPHYSKLTDEKAKELIKKKLGIESGIVLQSFERKERDAAVAKMDRAGLSERQIERLTGISRRIIHEILWN